jgi:hypothetical protein
MFVCPINFPVTDLESREKSVAEPNLANSSQEHVFLQVVHIQVQLKNVAS